MPQPTAAECEKYRTRYDEADQALHSLKVGAREVEIRMGEKGVKYSAASLPELERYVAFLRDKVRACDGCRATPRAFGVIPTN